MSSKRKPAPSEPYTGVTNLVFPFPLRPKYLAQICIPRDMTKEEAERLCAFVRSLASKP